MAHDADPVPQGQGLGIVVGDVDRCDPAQFLQGVELAPQLVADLGVEMADRLVQ